MSPCLGLRRKQFANQIEFGTPVGGCREFPPRLSGNLRQLARAMFSGRSRRQRDVTRDTALIAGCPCEFDVDEFLRDAGCRGIRYRRAGGGNTVIVVADSRLECRNRLVGEACLSRLQGTGELLRGDLGGE